MRLTSILAVYALFWTMCLFLVLPWHARTAEEAGEQSAPGHAESAPHSFRFGRVLIRTTLVSAILFGLFYANYEFGWITAADLDWSR